MSKHRYLDHWICLSKDISDGIYTVSWVPIDSPDDIVKRGGFYNGDDAYGYAEDCIDEYHLHLEQLGR